MPLSTSEAWILNSVDSIGIPTSAQGDRATQETKDFARTLWEATKIFARALTKEAVDTCLQERADDGPDGEGDRLLVPLHVFKVLCSKPVYDIFTNQGTQSSQNR